VTQAPALLAERFLLARDRRELVDLADLERRDLALRRRRPPSSARSASLARESASCASRPRRERIEPRERVEVPEVRRGSTRV